MQDHALEEQIGTEAEILLTYILGCHPPKSLIDRYSIIISNSENPNPVLLSKIFIKFPKLVRFIEPLNFTSKSKNSVLRQRLLLAQRIAEYSPEGARVFFSFQNCPLHICVFKIFLLCVIEFLILPFRLIFGR